VETVAVVITDINITQTYYIKSPAILSGFFVAVLVAVSRNFGMRYFGYAQYRLHKCLIALRKAVS
jgi:hypothetical protein